MKDVDNQGKDIWTDFRLPRRYFAAAGEKFRQFRQRNFSAIPVFENAQLLFNFVLMARKNNSLQFLVAKFFASGGEMLEWKTGSKVHLQISHANAISLHTWPWSWSTPW